MSRIATSRKLQFTVETHPPPIIRNISKLDVDSSLRFNLQSRLDLENFRFYPRLHASHEIWPGGTLALNDVASYRGRESLIFPIIGHRDLLLKYQADCEEISDGGINPLMLEFWYSNDAHKYGIAPRIIFLSPPIAFEVEAKNLSLFDMSRREREKCAALGGSVRFAVVQRIDSGVDLYTLKDRYSFGMLPFFMTMRIGIQLIEKLRDLHQKARVIHGDIHPGNIMVDGEMRVWLVDFGRSRANLPSRSKEPVNREFMWLSAMFSPWQIEGYEWSARDDVYNAVRTLALIFNGSQYREYERRMKQAGSRQLLHWKKTGQIWFSGDPGAYDPFRFLRVGPYRKEAIRQSLNRILVSVRKLNDVDAVPDYEKILREFENCMRLADPTNQISRY